MSVYCCIDTIAIIITFSSSPVGQFHRRDNRSLSVRSLVAIRGGITGHDSMATGRGFASGAVRQRQLICPLLRLGLQRLGREVRLGGLLATCKPIICGLLATSKKQPRCRLLMINQD